MVCLLSIWLHLPFSFIILYAARLSRSRRALRGRARSTAPRAGRPFAAITLPLLMPALLIAILFRYIFAFRLFSEVWLMTGGGPARTHRGAGGLSLSRSVPLQLLRRRRRDRLAARARLAPARAVLPARALPGDVRQACVSVSALAILKAIGIVAIVAWSILPIALIVMSSFKSDRDIFSLERALQLHADAGQLRSCSGAAGAISSTGCGTASSSRSARRCSPCSSRCWPASPIRAMPAGDCRPARSS